MEDPVVGSQPTLTVFKAKEKWKFYSTESS